MIDWVLLVDVLKLIGIMWLILYYKNRVTQLEMKTAQLESDCMALRSQVYRLEQNQLIWPVLDPSLSVLPVNTNREHVILPPIIT
jgi:hypothetical protein